MEREGVEKPKTWYFCLNQVIVGDLLSPGSTVVEADYIWVGERDEVFAYKLDRNGDPSKDPNELVGYFSPGIVRYALVVDVVVAGRTQ